MIDNSYSKRKSLAFELRKKGNSYHKIEEKLGIAKSTLSSWFRDKDFSSKIKEILIKRAQEKAKKQLRLLSLVHKSKWERIHLGYRNEAKLCFPKLVKHKFFGVGITIYWGEGDKNLKNGIVRVSNTDYRLLRIFTLFLLKTCKIKLEKIKVWLLLYPDLDKKVCINYWSNRLHLSLDHFVKPYCIKGREKTKRVHYGVCSVQVYSRELKEKILEWIDLYSVKLGSAGMSMRD